MLLNELEEPNSSARQYIGKYSYRDKFTKLVYVVS